MLHVRILMCAQYVCGCVCAYVPIYAYVCMCGCIHSCIHVCMSVFSYTQECSHSQYVSNNILKKMSPPLLEQLTIFSVHTKPFLSLGLTPGYLSFQTNWILNFAPLPHISPVTPMQFLLLTSLFTCSIRYEKSKIPIQWMNRYAPPPSESKCESLRMPECIWTCIDISITSYRGGVFTYNKHYTPCVEKEVYIYVDTHEHTKV